jgi:3-keto-L-gulonate-6-phosphate decarboxylase/transcriptional regulator with XRE-family HTH domain
MRAQARIRVAMSPPIPPADFWLSDTMRDAFAARHIGKVIRAYRMHPWHGHRPLPQELMAEWLNTTQSRLSRIETGSRIEQLDLLVHWATVLRIPQRHLWFALPTVHSPGARDPDVAMAAEPSLGALSTTRSAALSSPLLSAAGPAYVPAYDAIDRIRAFLAARSRVFLLTGPPGSGKTTLGFRLVEHLQDVADIQVHTIGSWLDSDDGLATEVLRYASLPDDGDAALRLETLSKTLVRPCLVVVDGMAAQEELNRVTGAVDRVFRQVLSDHLRFVLVVRTPPEPEVAGAPLVAATLFGNGSAGATSSHRMTPWSPSAAARAWDDSAESDVRYSQLPAAVRELARIPLYMRLLQTAGNGVAPQADAYELVGSCVRAALRTSGADPGQTRRRLVALSRRRIPELERVWSTLGAPRDDLAPSEDRLPLVRDSPNGPVFDHDVLGEYVAADAIAGYLRESGRSTSTVRALNEIAEVAVSSASTRGVFEFLAHALDRSAPDLLVGVASSPTVGLRTTLPLLLDTATSGGLAFASDDVLRACARRCHQEGSLELARSLLANPSLPKACAGRYPAWLNDVLRCFGVEVWPDMAAAIERALDAQDAAQMLAGADLVNPRDAVFFARHFFLFFGAEASFDAPLTELLGHADWRVRAALAGVRSAGQTALVSRICAVLVHDPDYKVRAAVARSIGHLDPAASRRLMAELLVDENWHVRGCALLGLLSGESPAAARDSLIAVAGDVLARESSWSRPPAHIAPLVARLAFLHGRPDPEMIASTRAGEQALFGLLREIRTGWRSLPAAAVAELRRQGRRSPSWVVQHEAAAETDPGDDVAQRREVFRRFRGGRAIQVALDLQDMEDAANVATAAARAGADFIEVGDPLIKRFGLAAVTEIKRLVPQTPVVAEMMSADWGRDQVELAAAAGADVVLLIGLSTAGSVASAVDAGRRLGVPLMLDTQPTRLDRGWVREMEREGVDAFVVTTNVDHGVRGGRPLDRAQLLRTWTGLPVAVSGGFGAPDRDVLASTHWDILIIGRSVAEAVDPGMAAQLVISLARRNQPRTTP